MELLPIGISAPDFEVKDQDGVLRRLSDFKGKKVVLYFYPQDNTPTCTKEACNLRDNHAELLKNGFIVLGISPDDSKSHLKFIAKHDLPFMLLADVGKEIILKYKVWGPKKLYGRDYDGVYRVTYIIDEQGMIAHVIPKVDSGNHTQQVLALYA